MHTLTQQQVRHTHTFDQCTKSNERKTMVVILITFITMGVEISAGMFTGSMALLADGYHMGTHALALGITWFAYIMARRYSDTTRFSFGTGKFGILAGYTSALFLGGTAVYMIGESIHRFFSPVNIGFNEAIIVAVVGLLVNVISVWVLHGNEHHHHDHHHHEDHNLKAAYLHVLADALTSVLAIVALLAGKYFGLVVLDPLMGIIGGILIWRWAWGLLKSSGFILLGGSRDETTRQEVLNAMEDDLDTRVVDLHLWHLSSNSLGLLVSLVAREPKTSQEYRKRLATIPKLDHVTIEIHSCNDKACSCRA
ncbi:MAG: CDF family Co(II)/Ni(II) efflux transporter DmeF [Deltaproteobacteria bacterium]|nr:CDF family Co(II)/Ni(II) efflux transporter DmeF [Deltaproteobacteria bacterium]